MCLFLLTLFVYNVCMSTVLLPPFLKELMQKYHLTPSKVYGQNYLISDRPIQAMLEAGELSARDVVLEVGPGFGILTLALLPRVQKVFAFEIEKKLEPYWQEKILEHPGLEMVWGNVLSRLSDITKNLTEYKVIANLPYQITSHILRLFLESDPKPERMVVMVQKEVAERICAKPGDMSLLALSVQYFGTPRIVTRVARGSFWPSPRVDSAVLAITNIQSPSQQRDFFRLAHAGFAHPRKQLWSNLVEGLKLDRERVKQTLREVVGNEKVRAEDLSVENWHQLVHKLS